MYVPQPLARVIFVFLGISLGAAVTPETLSRMAAWPVCMLTLALAMSCSTFCVAIYLNRVHGWDSMSALFAAAPGALSQALALAADTSADLRSVAIVQSVRVLVLAVVLPLIIAGLGMAGAAPEPLPMPPLRESLGELALLIILSTAAALFAYRVRLPGGLIVGRDADIGHFARHGLRALQSAAGGDHRLLCRSRRDDRLAIFRHRSRAPAAALHASFGALLVGMTVAGLSRRRRPGSVAQFRRRAGRLSPGGLEAMTILAFALHLDPAFVGAHHLWRFSMCR